LTKKILIIDDDLDTLKLVGLMLERQGYQIAVASNGTIGISKAAAENPDLILLDVMMPDLDGYEVTRRLRSDTSLAHIPIIMFTAKTMVDDKVQGFEAGVDDYLTKPTHPAELTAHVKAVLSRTREPQQAMSGGDRAQIIAFYGTRGGLGTTTLALNVGVALQQQGLDVIVAELNPGMGTMAYDLNLSESQGLQNLLTRSLKDIHLRSLDAEVVGHRSGIRLLLATAQPQDINLEQAVPQMEAITRNLGSMCNTLILDLGSGLRPYVKPILNMCDRIVLVVHPVFPSNMIAQLVLDDLLESGLIRHKTSMALVTLERTSLGIPWKQMEANLGIELAGIISPAAELAQQAAQSGNPLVLMHRDSLVSDQLRKVAEYIASYIQVPT
jgi:pilus assembly protein CpaE